MAPLAPASVSSMDGGRRRSGASVKTLKRALKKAGLKVSGKKATLTRRAKKAHLKLRGGADEEAMPAEEAPAAEEGEMEGARRRRRGSRKSSRKGFARLF